MANFLSTEPYKGTRDFFPPDMAVQRYIFDTWSTTAELFGYERYDASILEPSELYKSKGAENEEMVNEQTYTFTDRGDREVTLRPEMTPTVARMVAARRRDLSFPVRWYSIPNLFRYERMQRGRLREHWQLNCDIFGADDIAADVEIISLAYHVLKAFGARDTDFEIRVNDRREMRDFFASYDITDEQAVTSIIRLNDRFKKITHEAYLEQLTAITHNKDTALKICELLTETNEENALTQALKALDITNVVVDRSIARGFDYYTGTIFEIFDTDPHNNRSLIGGGRYDNLTALFGGEPISGVGFGMGDVTMRDFLETHGLLAKAITPTGPSLIIIPMETTYHTESEKVAQQFRAAGVRTGVDISTRKIAKKLSAASQSGAQSVLVIGENECTTHTYVLKELKTGIEKSGTIPELTQSLI